MGQPTYGQALTIARKVEAGSTVDSTIAFRMALARPGLACCLVAVAHSVGLLKQSGGSCFAPIRA